MEKIEIGSLAKHALNSKELRDLRDSAVERIASMIPHREIRNMDWDTFCSYAAMRIEKARNLILIGGHLDMAYDWFTVIGDLRPSAVEVSLDSLLAPVRARFADGPSETGYQTLMSEVSDSSAYLARREEVLDALFNKWKTSILLTYQGLDFIDFRPYVARTESLVLILTPGPADLLHEVMSLALYDNSYRDTHFVQSIGKALSRVINYWIHHFERLNGFYGRFALAVQYVKDPNGDFLIPFSFQAFKGLLDTVVSPEYYANIAVEGSPVNVWKSMLAANDITASNGQL